MWNWFTSLFTGDSTQTGDLPKTPDGLLGGAVKWFFGLFVGGSFASEIVSWFLNNSGYEDLGAFMDAKKPGWRDWPIIGSILSFFDWATKKEQSIRKGFTDWVSQKFDEWGLSSSSKLKGEQLEAAKDGAAQIDKDYGDIDDKVGITGATEQVKTFAKSAMQKFLTKKSNSASDLQAAEKDLHDAIVKYMLEQQGPSLKGKASDNEIKIAAEDVANYASSHFAQMLKNLQSEIDKPSTYTSGSTTLPTVPFNTALLTDAKAKLHL